ncbi:MAG: MFS transporter [bacterium]|nr:MFS transporter [bacterium]
MNLSDGAFFGLGLSLASYTAVIPLFLSTLTESVVLIGLMSAMHEIGWYLPQLLTAERVARLRRYKPLAILMTLNERIPFFFLALIALAIPAIGAGWALVFTFIAIVWQAMGGGLTATAWQSMIAKIMPIHVRGTFYSVQSAAANLTGSGGAVLAGLLLTVVAAPTNFALCFFLCGVTMMISWFFLAWTREPESEPNLVATQKRDMGVFFAHLRRIIAQDSAFRWFLVARMLAMFSAIGLYFYAIFAKREFGLDEGQIGIMTGVLFAFTVLANPILGWLGDRWSHRVMYGVAILFAGGSALVAVFATSPAWLYVGFALLGMAKAGLWTIPLPLTAQFGHESDRPYYIGLANTLVAPAALIAPILGGAMADAANFNAAFALAVVAGLAGAAVMFFVVREPRSIVYAATQTAAAPAGD